MEKRYEPTQEELIEQEEMSNLALGALEQLLESRKSLHEQLEREGFDVQGFLEAHLVALEHAMFGTFDEDLHLEYLGEDLGEE